MTEIQLKTKKIFKKGQKATLVSGIIAFILFFFKILIGFFSNSSALQSDALNNFSDLMIMVASWIGFRISKREKTLKFQFGFYKAESLMTLTLSIFMTLGTIFLFFEGFYNIFELPVIYNPFFALTISIISIGLSFVISRYLRYMGVKINSDLLILNSKERMIDVISSFIVFIAILASSFQIPFIEGVITMVISTLVFRIGIISIKDAIFSLMDVSPSKKFDESIKEILNEIEGVDDFKDLKLRKSGSLIFGEVKINVRKTINVDKAHEISEKIESQIYKIIPQIESFMVYIEPSEKKLIKIVIPIKNKKDLNSEIVEHFGRANFFFLGNIENYILKESEILKNPFIDKKIRAGLSVAKFFIQKEIDILFTMQIGEISYHLLRDHLVDIYSLNKLSVNTVEKVLNEYQKGNLSKLLKPTREKD